MHPMGAFSDARRRSAGVAEHKGNNIQSHSREGTSKPGVRRGHTYIKARSGQLHGLSDASSAFTAQAQLLQTQLNTRVQRVQENTTWLCAHLHRRDLRGDLCEPHNVGEENGYTLVVLRLNLDVTPTAESATERTQKKKLMPIPSVNRVRPCIGAYKRFSY